MNTSQIVVALAKIRKTSSSLDKKFEFHPPSNEGPDSDIFEMEYFGIKNYRFRFKKIRNKFYYEIHNLSTDKYSFQGPESFADLEVHYANWLISVAEEEYKNRGKDVGNQLGIL